MTSRVSGEGDGRGRMEGASESSQQHKLWYRRQASGLTPPKYSRSDPPRQAEAKQFAQVHTLLTTSQLAGSAGGNSVAFSLPRAMDIRLDDFHRAGPAQSGQTKRQWAHASMARTTCITHQHIPHSVCSAGYDDKRHHILGPAVNGHSLIPSPRMQSVRAGFHDNGGEDFGENEIHGRLITGMWCTAVARWSEGDGA